MKRGMENAGSAARMLALAAGFCGVACAQALEVVALHPLMGDLARNVGGGEVGVTDFMGLSDDVHSFQPSPSQMARAASADLVLASGKHLETYLDKLRDSLPDTVEVVEVGRPIRSMRISADDELFVCCPAHTVGGIDPHWWHSVDNMKRAARVVADAFGEADPSNRSAYQSRAAEYIRRLDVLDGWIRAQVSRIPQSDRKLVTAHLAFGYFCRDYGFRALPVQGLTRERQATAQYLAETVETLRGEGVKAVFPEHQANPKVLEQLVAETGVKLGGRLIADGNGHGAASSYEGMMRHNVEAIVAALRP